MTLDPEIRAFADLLHQIEALLAEYDQTQWAAKVASCLASVERSDAQGLQRFLSFFGGMGSLNDVLLCRDGAPISVSNDKLRTLLNRAYEAARRLERDT